MDGRQACAWDCISGLCQRVLVTTGKEAEEEIHPAKAVAAETYQQAGSEG